MPATRECGPDCQSSHQKSTPSLLQAAVQHLEVGGEERRSVTSNAIGRRSPGSRPEGGGHRRVGVLERADPVGRVDVEGDPQSAARAGRRGTLRVGEEVALPAVAGPAAAVLGRHGLDAVPVHVHDRDAESGRPRRSNRSSSSRYSVGGVAVVPAPPVAERPPRQQGLVAGHGVEGLERAGEVVAVREDVEVEAVAVWSRRDPAVLRRTGRRRSRRSRRSRPRRRRRARAGCGRRRRRACGRCRAGSRPRRRTARCCARR